MTKRIFNRRQLLRGFIGGLGVSAGLPLFDCFLNRNGNAYADQSPLPNRFGVFFWGNGRGADASRWAPAATGNDFELSPLLAPLESVKSYLNIATNMDVKTNTRNNHHRGTAAMLSGAEFTAQDPGNANFGSTFSLPSIDQVAAQAIGADTPFRSLEVGISEVVGKDQGTTLHTLSHNGPNNVNPAELDPGALFDRLFGVGTPGAEASVLEMTTKLRVSALDAVLTDAQSLSRSLGGRDRVRLEQHMDHLRAMESRLQAGERAAHCPTPARPSLEAASADRELLSEKMALMTELLATAVSCDLTRVFSVMFTGSIGETIMWQAGSDLPHHSLTHEPDRAEEIEACTLFTMTQLSVLLKRLAETPEGDGSLLDHMAVLATSDLSDGYEHSVQDMPIIVAGGANGALRTPGTHYRGNGDNTSDVLLTLMRAVGVPLEEFGGGGGLSTTTVSAFES